MNKRIVILGAGESGTGSAVLAKIKGFDVFISDSGLIKPKYKKILSEYSIPFEEDQHTLNLILSADEVIKSPGIPDNSKIILQLKDLETPVISEIEFAGRYTDAFTICITGSNGKTTTTMLTYHILKKAGMNVGLAGNVGKSFAFQVATEEFDYYVIELSSFQLDGIYQFNPDIAILMNITPDHLDRYNYNFNEYVDSKMRVCMNQTESDFLIYCSDDETSSQEIKSRNIKSNIIPFSLNNETKEGAFIEENKLKINYNKGQFNMTLQELALHGKHNMYNSMAAGIACNVLQIRKEIIRESLADFQGVEHRLENYLKIQGIQFINDSKATNINSTWYALESMNTQTVWIVGGIDKGNDYSMLLDLIKSRVKAIVCLGVDNSKIHAAFDGIVDTIIDTNSMKDAVNAAYYLSKKGDNVLLSPACASFDLFQNFEDRGRQFKQFIREL